MTRDDLNTMAWEMVGVGQLKLRKFELPRPGSGEIIVRVSRIGICGSDVSAFRGAHPYKVPPAVLGHELSGTVEWCGAGVDLDPGEPVVSMSYASCGTCRRCTGGSMNLCKSKENLSHRGWIGALSEKVLLKESMVLPVPDRVTPEAAVLAEPLAVSVHAIRLAGDPAGRRMAIVGMGSIGTGCAFAAQNMGWHDVIGFDISVMKTERGSRFGMTECHTGSPSAIGGSGAHGEVDVALVCSGHRGAIEAATKLVAPGGTVVVVAFFDHHESIDASALARREVTLTGSSLCVATDMELALSLLEGEPLLSEMITHEFGFDDVPTAVTTAGSGASGVGKVVVNSNA